MNAIYLSGPMSGLPDFNRPAFFAAEEKLARCMEATFINPARINGTETAGWSWSDYMRVALRAMMDASSIYMLNGWESSKGAQLELEIAMQLGMPVHFQPPKLADWAALIEGDGLLILDTETTGLGNDAEIVEIAVIDQRGKVLLNSLVKPTQNIPGEVSQIHGITAEVVERAPGWDQVSKELLRVLHDRPASRLVAWNASFDVRMIQQTDKATGQKAHAEDIRLFGWHGVTCAQNDYSKRRAERKETGHIKRQSLASACKQLGIQQDSNKAHRALYDCHMTLEVIKALVNKQIDEGAV